MSTATLFKEWKQIKNAKLFENLDSSQVKSGKFGWYSSKLYNNNKDLYVFFIPNKDYISNYSYDNFVDEVVNGNRSVKTFSKTIDKYALKGTIKLKEEALKEGWKSVIEVAVKELKNGVFCADSTGIQAQCAIFLSPEFKNTLSEMFPDIDFDDFFFQLDQLDKEDYITLIEDLFQSPYVMDLML